MSPRTAVRTATPRILVVTPSPVLVLGLGFHINGDVSIEPDLAELHDADVVVIDLPPERDDIRTATLVLHRLQREGVGVVFLSDHHLAVPPSSRVVVRPFRVRQLAAAITEVLDQRPGPVDDGLTRSLPSELPARQDPGSLEPSRRRLPRVVVVTPKPLLVFGLSFRVTADVTIAPTLESLDGVDLVAFDVTAFADQPRLADEVVRRLQREGVHVVLIADGELTVPEPARVVTRPFTVKALASLIEDTLLLQPPRAVAVEDRSEPAPAPAPRVEEDSPRPDTAPSRSTDVTGRPTDREDLGTSRGGTSDAGADEGPDPASSAAPERSVEPDPVAPRDARGLRRWFRRTTDPSGAEAVAEDAAAGGPDDDLERAEQADASARTPLPVGERDPDADQLHPDGAPAARTDDERDADDDGAVDIEPAVTAAADDEPIAADTSTAALDATGADALGDAERPSTPEEPAETDGQAAAAGTAAGSIGQAQPPSPAAPEVAHHAPVADAAAGALERESTQDRTDGDAPAEALEREPSSATAPPVQTRREDQHDPDASAEALTDEHPDIAAAPPEAATEDEPEADDAPAEAATDEHPDTAAAPARAATEDGPEAEDAPAEAATDEHPDAADAPAEAVTEDEPDVAHAPAEAATEEEPEVEDAAAEASSEADLADGRPVIDDSVDEADRPSALDQLEAGGDRAATSGSVHVRPRGRLAAWWRRLGEAPSTSGEPERRTPEIEELAEEHAPAQALTPDEPALDDVPAEALTQDVPAEALTEGEPELADAHAEAIDDMDRDVPDTAEAQPDVAASAATEPVETAAEREPEADRSATVEHEHPVAPQNLLVAWWRERLDRTTSEEPEPAARSIEPQTTEPTPADASAVEPPPVDERPSPPDDEAPVSLRDDEAAAAGSQDETTTADRAAEPEAATAGEVGTADEVAASEEAADEAAHDEAQAPEPEVPDEPEPDGPPPPPVPLHDAAAPVEPSPEPILDLAAFERVEPPPPPAPRPTPPPTHDAAAPTRRRRTRRELRWERRTRGRRGQGTPHTTTRARWSSRRMDASDPAQAEMQRRLAAVFSSSSQIEQLAKELPLVRSMSALLVAITDVVAEVLDADTAALWRRTDEGWVAAHHHGFTAAEATWMVPLDQPLLREIDITGGSILMDPVESMQAAVVGIGGAHTRSIMAACIAAGEGRYGIITVGRDRPLEPHDLDHLTDLALEASLAVAVAEHIERVRDLVVPAPADRAVSRPKVVDLIEPRLPSGDQ
jgi:hypothetical protein